MRLNYRQIIDDNQKLFTLSKIRVLVSSCFIYMTSNIQLDSSSVR